MSTVAAERESITIEWAGGLAVTGRVRGHLVTADQPREEGGEDRGVTPVEMFIVSLGACVGYFALRFFARHGRSPEGLRIAVDWSMGERPRRVGAIGLRVTLPGAWTEAERTRLQAVLEACTVHNSITHPPEIAITLA